MSEKPTKYYSNKQEKLVASYLSMKVVSGSGAADCHPGDVQNEDWLCECKTHVESGKKIMFNLKVWSKICDEAMYKFKNALLVVDDGSQTIENTWVMFDTNCGLCSECKKVPLPGIVKSNITFDSTRMKEHYKSICKDNSHITILVYNVVPKHQQVGIVPIDIFLKMLRGM